jgi:hypothetical protein
MVPPSCGIPASVVAAGGTWKARCDGCLPVEAEDGWVKPTFNLFLRPKGNWCSLAVGVLKKAAALPQTCRRFHQRGSVTVPVTVPVTNPGPPRSLPIVIRNRKTLLITKGLPSSITLRLSLSQSFEEGLRIGGLQVQLLSGAPIDQTLM